MPVVILRLEQGTHRVEQYDSCGSISMDHTEVMLESCQRGGTPHMSILHDRNRNALKDAELYLEVRVDAAAAVIGFTV
jgi:hypothetical protein